jgi:hopanoid biosynthesis associated RND transporter like protein HpnN
MKSSLAETWFGRALGLVADLVIRHRWLFLWPQVLLLVASVAYTALYLKIDPSRDNLVGSGKKYHQNFLRFEKEFPAQGDLVVVVESENAEKNRQFVERLGAKMEAETNLFADVLYRSDFKMLGRKALLFAETNDLASIRDTLANYLPFIEKFTQATNLDTLFEMVNFQFLHGRREANKENEALVKAIPMLGAIANQAIAAIQRPGTPPSPGVTALFGGGDQDIYITYPTKRGWVYLVTAHVRMGEKDGKEVDNSGEAVDELQKLTALTQREVPGLNVGVTGEPVLEQDEMEQSRKDSTVAGVVSLLVCSLIFIYGYQETGRPLKATLCLIVGLGYTLAFTTLTIGHLNILTITFFPILIGLAIDFGVHLITRYEEELGLGRSEEQAIRKALVFTGQGVFTGALTTSAAFLAMILTNFKGIQEMGVICGGGMVICFIPMITMLPVLLFRGRQNVIDHERASRPALRARIERVWLKRPVAVTLVTAGLCALALTQFHKVYFDYDLLHMQSKGLPAVVFEEKLIESTPKSVIFGAVVADTAEQAVELENKLKTLPTVEEVESMASRVIGDQTGKLELIGEIKKEIEPVNFAPPDMDPVRIPRLSATLYSTYGYLGAAADDVSTNDPALAKQLLDLRQSINDLRKEMLTGDPEMVSRKLGEFQQALFRDVQDTFQSLKEQDNSSPLRAEDLPQTLRSRFIGVTGKYLLQVYPKKDIWQHDNQEEFVKQLRTVDENVTGTPVQLYEYTTLLKDSYEQAAWYALAVIMFMVLVHFRTVSSVILTLLPVGIGSIWMGGLMGYFGIPFNPANIMTLPLVIGIGVTNGIHILNRFAEEKQAGILSKSTGKAVFVSGLTTISGFGSLMLAQHQGIKSLGYVMAMGVATCMIAALTFLPAMLKLLAPWRTEQKEGAEDHLETKQPSGDNGQATLGREEPRSKTSDAELK